MDNTSEIAFQFPFRVGEPMPDFSLPLASAEGSSTCTLESLGGEPFVLFVYPKDGTCDCTLVANDFRDLHGQFEQLGVRVLGLSRDTIGAHKKFIAAQGFPFALLSDASQETLRNWNLIYAATMYGKPVTKVRRTTILADASGTVRRVWEGVAPAGHAAQVLEAARQLARC